MSEANLRKAVIRLAYEKPELRSELLGLVRGVTAKEEEEDAAEAKAEEAKGEEPGEKKEEKESKAEAKAEEAKGEEPGEKKASDNSSLRKQVIRLAYQKEHLRPTLLGLLDTGKEATTDSDLRKKIIRLAHETPTLREDLLPLVV